MNECPYSDNSSGHNEKLNEERPTISEKILPLDHGARIMQNESTVSNTCIIIC